MTKESSKLNIRFYNLSDEYLQRTKAPIDLKSMTANEFEQFISNGFLKLLVDSYSDSLHSYIKQIKLISQNVTTDLGHLESNEVATVSRIDEFLNHVAWITGPQMNITVKPKHGINLAKKNLKSLKVGFDTSLDKDSDLRDFIRKRVSNEFVALKKFYSLKYGGTKEMDEFLSKVYEKNSFIFSLAGMRTYNLETFNRFVRRKITSRTKS